MPHCEGRPPIGVCPDNRIDSSVTLSKGDLMLCRACEESRFPAIAAARLQASATASPRDDPPAAESGHGTTSSSDCSPNGDDQSSKRSALPSLIVSEPLFFISNTYDNYAASLIKTTAVEFYREDEILSAKSKLITSTEGIAGLSIQHCCKNRIGVNKARASFEDIMNIFAVVDEAGKRTCLPTFCAADRKRIPVPEEEMSELCALRHEVAQLKKLVESTGEGLGLAGLYHEMQSLQQQVGELSKLLTIEARSPEIRTDAVPGCSGVEDFCVPPTDHTPPAPSSIVPTVDKPMEEQSSSVQSAPGYADIAKRNSDWQTVNRGKSKLKKKVVVGESKKTCTLQGVTKKAVVCVNRLDPSSTTEMVSDFLVSKGIDVLTCHVVKQDNRVGPCNFISMRLCIPHVHLAKIMDKDLWPLGITVRPWHFKPRPTDSDSA